MRYSIAWKCNGCPKKNTSQGNAREIEFMLSEFRAHMAQTGHVGFLHVANEPTEEYPAAKKEAPNRQLLTDALTGPAGVDA